LLLLHTRLKKYATRT